MQLIGEVRTSAGAITIVDDYGHQPTEIAATLDALRQSYPERRLVVVFQPHRDSRTRDLPEVVRRADVLVVAVGVAELVRGEC